LVWGYSQEGVQGREVGAVGDDVFQGLFATGSWLGFLGQIIVIIRLFHPFEGHVDRK
jgi:hypothetical protein